jgi:drug/metabolite transporter (DMT)-like permease
VVRQCRQRDLESVDRPQGLRSSAITISSPRQSTHGLPRIGFVWGFLSGMMWGLDGVMLGVVLTMAPFVGASTVYAPLVVACVHDGLATGWMLAYDGVTGKLRRLPHTVGTRRGLIICAAALLGGPMAMSGYLFGIKFAGAAYTMAISATFPAVGAVLSRIFLRERISLPAWMGVALTVLGAVVVTYTPPEGDAPRFYLGIALALLATLGWGIEGVLAIHSMEVIDSAVAGTIRLATSFLVYLVVALPLTRGLRMFVAAFDSRSFWTLVLASAAGAGAYLTYYTANHLIGASRAMPLNAMYALWAILFGIVITGLHPTWQLETGVLVMLTGAVFVVRGAPRAIQAAEAPASCSASRGC